jgi:D-alanyl-D-alanine carboxypeptidase
MNPATEDQQAESMMNTQTKPRLTPSPVNSDTASQSLSRRHALQLTGLSGLDLIAPALLAGCGGNDVLLGPKVLTQEVKAQLEAATDSVFAQVAPTGMIALISVDGEGDYYIRRGVSNRLTGATMNEENYFRIGSNTKTLTGAAVLILADEGKINLDSPIASYLPEYNIPNGDRITVRMLGNMTSGLFNYSDDEQYLDPFIASGYSLAYTPQQLLAIALRHPPYFLPGPGAKHKYCNTDIVVLGLLMEKVTGKSAKQVIDEKVILPMGLTHTDWPDSGALAAPYTHGYSSQDDSGNLMDVSAWNPSWGYTAGVLVSTFADMKIWARAVADGSLLSERSRAERFKWVDDQYGFCLMKAGHWIGHPGTIFGYNSHVFFHAQKKITFVILVNQAIPDVPVEDFSAALRTILD